MNCTSQDLAGMEYKRSQVSAGMEYTSQVIAGMSQKSHDTAGMDYRCQVRFVLPLKLIQ